MAEFLCIRLKDEPGPVASAMLNADGHLLRSFGRQPLTALAGLAEGRKTVVLVPPTPVVSLRASVPKASPGRLRQLLPYSLEDQFAQDVESLQFAAGDRFESGDLGVSVVAREQLDEWLATCRDSGLNVSAMYSASDGVPDTPNTVNIVIDGATVMGRVPGEPPIALDGISLPEIWDLLTTDRDDEAPHYAMVYGAADDLAERRAELDELRLRVANVEARELGDGSLQRLASTVVARGGANLLQGAYAPKSDLKVLARPWLAAAALFAAVIALAVIAEAVALVKLRSDDQALTEAATAICAESYSSRLLSACRAEMQRRLADIGESAGGSRPGLLSSLAIVADSSPAGMQIEAIVFRNDVLDLELIVPGVTELDELAQRISGTEQFDVRMGTNTPDAGGLKSRIQVVGRTP